MTPPAFAQCNKVAEVESPAALRLGIDRQNRPLVLRGAVAHWPLVTHGQQSPEALVDYLTSLISSELVDTVIAPPAPGRLLYEEGLSALNHQHSIENLSHVLRGLLKQVDAPEPIGISLQGLDAARTFARLEQSNSTDLVPPGTQARLWIGNAVTVAPHFDAADNLACVAAGRRRFVLFPPEQVGNLYVGQFDVTPPACPSAPCRSMIPISIGGPATATPWPRPRSQSSEPGDGSTSPIWASAAPSLARSTCWSITGGTATRLPPSTLMERCYAPATHCSATCRTNTARRGARFTIIMSSPRTTLRSITCRRNFDLRPNQAPKRSPNSRKQSPGLFTRS